jgi:HK97 family phage portal protein
MKLVPDSVRALVTLARDIAGVPFNLNSPLMWKHFGGSSYADGELLLSYSDAWRYSVWVRRCIRSISQSIAELPFEVYRDADKIEEHPLLDLIQNPAPNLSQNDLWQLTIMMLVTFGEAFWLLDRKGTPNQVTKIKGSFPKSIVIATPEIMSPDIDDATGELRGWFVQTPKQRRWVSRLDVAHFKFSNPFNRYRGAAPLESAGFSVSSDVHAQRFNIKIFKGARPGVVMETEKQLQQTIVDAIREDFVARHRTPHIPAILHSGLKLASQPSPSDMEFSKAREMNREEILAAFGVPPIEVGLLEYASYANAKEQRRAYWQTTLKPIIGIISDTIAMSLLGDLALPQSMRAPQIKAEHCTDDVVELREDLNEKLTAAEKMWTKGVPWNAIDELLDIGTGPIVGGDIGYLPFSVQPISVVANPPEPDPAPASGDGGTNVPADTQPRGSQTYSATDTLLTQLEAAIREERAKPIVAPPATTRESDPLHWLDEIMRASKEALRDLAKKPLAQALQVGGQQMIETLGLSVVFDMEAKPAIDFMTKKLIAITQIEDYTREKLRETLLEGLSKGESQADLAKRIRDLYNFASSRSKTIARTEVSQSVNGGRFIVLKNEGAERHEWVTSRDERVRETHREEDGHVVVVGQPFQVTHLAYPGDVVGSPAEIINCRCITLPVIDDRRAFRAIDRDAYWTRAVAQYEPIENRLAAAVKRHFFEQRSKILEALAAKNLH